MTNYVFDIDGTLTPSRQKMTNNMKELLLKLMENNPVYLVTGSNIEKTMEQVPMDILTRCREVFCESGSDVYYHDSNYEGLLGRESNYDSHWDCPVELRNMLMNLLNDSKFPTTMRTGNHIEIRKSMVNFSIIGRNATTDERYVYTLWDKDKSERGMYAKQIEEYFPELTATVAGEIGIDIHPKGKDKSQIRKDIRRWGDKPIVFFGDKTEKGGNDYPLAESLEFERDTFHIKNVVHQVLSWQDTYRILEGYIK
jgi:phosphomannomutase